MTEETRYIKADIRFNFAIPLGKTVAGFDSNMHFYRTFNEKLSEVVKELYASGDLKSISLGSACIEASKNLDSSNAGKRRQILDILYEVNSSNYDRAGSLNFVKELAGKLYEKVTSSESLKSCKGIISTESYLYDDKTQMADKRHHSVRYGQPGNYIVGSTKAKQMYNEQNKIF